MASGKLQVNKNIEIEVKDSAYAGVYQSKISQINEDTIEVLTPIENSEIVPLRKGTVLKVFYTGQRAAYKFKSQIIDRFKEPIPTLIIKYPQEVNRIQRRDYFRLEYQLDLKYCLVDEEGSNISDFHETVTCDISGGGIRMVLNEELEVNTIIKLFITGIPQIEQDSIIGEIVNIYDSISGKAAGVEFVDITAKTQDEIVGWLFDKQREMRKKGLI